MEVKKRNSAGIIVTRGNPIRILLCRLGGPFFAKTPLWTIPKGEIDEGEMSCETARREFFEETGKIPPDKLEPYTTFKTARGMCELWIGESTPELDLLEGIQPTVSNTCKIEWPPKSGIKIEIPETIEMGFFTLEEAHALVSRGQLGVLVQLKLTHLQTQPACSQVSQQNPMSS